MGDEDSNEDSNKPGDVAGPQYRPTKEGTAFVVDKEMDLESPFLRDLLAETGAGATSGHSKHLKNSARAIVWRQGWLGGPLIYSPWYHY